MKRQRIEGLDPRLRGDERRVLEPYSAAHAAGCRCVGLVEGLGMFLFRSPSELKDWIPAYAGMSGECLSPAPRLTQLVVDAAVWLKGQVCFSSAHPRESGG